MGEASRKDQQYFKTLTKGPHKKNTFSTLPLFHPTGTLMSMSYFYAYPDVDPHPTTHVAHTFLEKSHHLHHVPIPFLAHKVHKVFHDKDQDVHVPKSDVRETPKSFYLEVELPGIKDKSELHLRWTSTRTLLVTSKIHRPEIPESDMLEEASAEAGAGAGGGTIEPTPTPAAAGRIAARGESRPSPIIRPTVRPWRRGHQEGGRGGCKERTASDRPRAADRRSDACVQLPGGRGPRQHACQAGCRIAESDGAKGDAW